MSAFTSVSVLDHSKFDAGGWHLVLAAGEIDCLITDDGLDPSIRSHLASEPYNLIVAEQDGACEEKERS